METKDAVGIARDYLLALERRSLADAKACLAPGIAFAYPGGRRPGSIEEVMASSRSRYKGVYKTIQRTDAFRAENGDCVVYIIGLLHGTWPDGADFKEIRFIDRFEIGESGISRHEVWNDAANVRLGLQERSGKAPGA